MRYLLCLSLTLTPALTLTAKADERPSVGLTSAKKGESPGVEVRDLLIFPSRGAVDEQMEALRLAARKPPGRRASPRPRARDS